MYTGSLAVANLIHTRKSSTNRMKRAMLVLLPGLVSLFLAAGSRNHKHSTAQARSHCPQARWNSTYPTRKACHSRHNQTARVTRSADAIKKFCDDYQQTCVDTQLTPPYDHCMAQAATMLADQSNVKAKVASSDTFTCRRFHLE